MFHAHVCVCEPCSFSNIQTNVSPHIHNPKQSQLCLILGLPLYFGPGRVMRLLFNKDKLRASACFCLGVFLVLRGNSFLGTLLEVFGFFNLFACVFVLCCLRVELGCKGTPFTYVHPHRPLSIYSYPHSNMFPLLLALLRNVPVVGELLKRPEPSSGRRDYYRQDDYDRGGGGGRGRW